MENMNIPPHIIFLTAFYLAAQNLVAGRRPYNCRGQFKALCFADHLVFDLHTTESLGKNTSL